MDSKAEVPKNEKKLKYPKAIFAIISTEFCERFSYYGMRTILALYIKNKLDFSDDTSTIIFHTFTMLVYAFPLVGAMLADSLLGKFRTILYFNIIYCLGQLLLSASAVPTFGLPIREISMIGLLFIAMGTGGIKPCVSALGGDQFTLPEQERHLAMYFSVFYFTINAGSLVSSFLTPELRNGIKCFGDQECYAIAFFVPAALMVLAIVIFAMGKPLYRIKKPEGNVVLSAIRCISHAVCEKSKSDGTTKRGHWLDYADDEYDSKLIFDLKAALGVLKILIPLPVFWALAEQQGSRWTFQAARMNGEIGNFLVKADQMQMVNALLILGLIPIIETCLYPRLTKFKCLDTQLKRLTTGGMLAAVAFVIAALVELKLETTYPILPTNGSAQVRIFNPRDCHLPIVINNQSLVMEPFGIWANTAITVIGNRSIPYVVDFSQCGGVKKSEGLITAVEGQATSYVLEPSSPYSYKDYVNKTSSGNPAVRVLIYNLLNSNVTTTVELSEVKFVFEANGASDIPQITPINNFYPGTYQVKVNGIFVDSIVLKLGGVYTLQTYVTANGTRVGLTTVTPPNSVHMLWLLPQYMVLTIGEVMFCVTGLRFVFTQAPSTMKSLLQAAWLLTIAFGNLIVVIIAKAKIFDRQSSEFFFFAGLMAVGMMILAIMGKSYKYRNFNNDRQSIECKDSGIDLKEMHGHGKTISADGDETAKLWNFNHEPSC
ncbi:peptide transporter family 1 [Diachasma alloeum]|uniref:peptide transporter family 1 n=1 Tax=Diachasma alloeum TaxID=454923 RepID=UPI0007382B93|nr:peptide transporter family 1 [Diachasma alloeum]